MVFQGDQFACQKCPKAHLRAFTTSKFFRGLHPRTPMAGGGFGAPPAPTPARPTAAHGALRAPTTRSDATFSPPIICDKFTPMKPTAHKSSTLYRKCIENHPRASTIPQFFLGSLALAIRKDLKIWSSGWGRPLLLTMTATSTKTENF